MFIIKTLLSVKMTDFDLEPFGIHQTKRLTVQSAEDILYTPLNVFNNGFIRLVDYMGGDDAITYAATGGVGKELIGSNIDTVDFFNYLHNNGIPDPFDFVQVKLHLEIPISTALFWVYRKQFRINEYSGRYSEMINKMQTYDKGDLASLFESAGEKVSDRKLESLVELISRVQDQSRAGYEIMLSGNFARELARIGLPLSNYTSFYLSANFYDLLNTIELTRKRLKNDPDLNEIGEIINEILTSIAPKAVESFWSRKESDLEIKVNYDLLEENPNLALRYGLNQTKRLTVQNAEEDLFVPQFFLENNWFMPTDYMGSDQSIVQSARVSYGAGTKQVSEDAVLIRYLRRHQHTTPFEHVSLQFEAKTPIFVSPRQCLRHRTMNREGVLGNFIPLKEWYNIPEEQIRKQSRSNRQGRGNKVDELAKEMINSNLGATFKSQAWAISELEGTIIPDYIKFGLYGVGHLNRWSANQDLHNAFKFLNLRNDPHAQFEIQELAKKYQGFVSKVAPIAAQAWLNYEKNAIRIHDNEKYFIIRMLKEGKTEIPLEWFREKGWILKDGGTESEKPNREASELMEKIEQLLRTQT